MPTEESKQIPTLRTFSATILQLNCHLQAVGWNDSWVDIAVHLIVEGGENEPGWDSFRWMFVTG